MNKPVIITCAPTGGIHTPIVSPHLPITPAELATSNAQQVRKIRTIVESLGLEVTTPAEARERLALKGGDQVGF